MNEKKYTLAGCNNGEAVLIAEKQTLFQSLFITLSQLEELEYLILEDGEFWFNSEELKLRISNDLNFNMEISTPSGFCFFSLIKDGGEF